MKRVKLKIAWGTHLPVLMKIIGMTTGPVVECGGGLYSTPFLHWACFSSGRRLITYEGDREFFNNLSGYNNGNHKVRLVADWDKVDLSEPWEVAFIDHEPPERRALEMQRLVHADYVIAHDTERRVERRYGYPNIKHLFKYNYKYRGASPHTSIFSNKHDLTGFTI